MLLSRKKILECMEAGEIGITPFIDENLEACSYLFTLGHTYFELDNAYAANGIDLREGKIRTQEKSMEDDGVILHPGDFKLFPTGESIKLSDNYACILGTRSSCARMGLDVMQTSILVDPGSNHPLTMEISNVGPYPVTLYPGMGVMKGMFIPVE
ncbi:MAG: dCTP deaminase [Alphaproteobacteria bacterium]|nr:dCTP deaminase [Alphaproteobacteria bacterium]MDD9919108.1 dCTP deaminase [Alphaproteobacteria bacterium]